MITVLYSSAKWEGLVPCATVAIRASSGSRLLDMCENRAGCPCASALAEVAAARCGGISKAMVHVVLKGGTG